MRIHMRMMAAGLAVLAMLAACGGQDSADGGPDHGRGAAAATELTQAQLERGIGPVAHVELGALDHELVAEGREIFDMKCAPCHQLEGRLVGPELGDVIERRTPEFVMNMMLNPAEMVERHPTVREMLAQYYTPMPDQNLTAQDARAVLEYLRTAGASDEAR
jgi:cytochrome c